MSERAKTDPDASTGRRRGWLPGALSIFVALAGFATPAAAALDYFYTDRQAYAGADFTHDSSYFNTYDYQERDERFLEAGVWDLEIEARTEAIEGAPDGVGRASVRSDIAPARIAFESRLFAAGGEYHVSGGTPGDVASEYYTDEWTGGLADARLFAEFRVHEETPFEVLFRSLGPAANAGDVTFSLTRHPTIIPPGGVYSEGVIQSATILDHYAGGTASLTGMLQPGFDYRFGIDHDHVPNAESAIEILFVVPEPGTALLLGVGLAGLGATRRHE